MTIVDIRIMPGDLGRAITELADLADRLAVPAQMVIDTGALARRPEVEISVHGGDKEDYLQEGYLRGVLERAGIAVLATRTRPWRREP